MPYNKTSKFPNVSVPKMALVLLSFIKCFLLEFSYPKFQSILIPTRLFLLSFNLQEKQNLPYSQFYFSPGPRIPAPALSVLAWGFWAVTSPLGSDCWGCWTRLKVKLNRQEKQNPHKDKPTEDTQHKEKKTITI